MPPPRKHKNLPPGMTLSTNSKYVRITAGPNRDKYAHRVEAEQRLGRKLSQSEVVDHRDPSTKSDPKAKTKVMDRSAHSKAQGGLRTGTYKKPKGRK